MYDVFFFSRLLQQIVSGNISTNGTPIEVFISDGGGFGGSAADLGGLFSGLTGSGARMMPFPGLASNFGDYAFGNISNIINDLMRTDPNRVSRPSCDLILIFGVTNVLTHLF